MTSETVVLSFLALAFALVHNFDGTRTVRIGVWLLIELPRETFQDLAPAVAGASPPQMRDDVIQGYYTSKNQQSANALATCRQLHRVCLTTEMSIAAHE